MIYAKTKEKAWKLDWDPGPRSLQNPHKFKSWSFFLGVCPFKVSLPNWKKMNMTQPRRVATSKQYRLMSSGPECENQKRLQVRSVTVWFIPERFVLGTNRPCIKTFFFLRMIIQFRSRIHECAISLRSHGHNLESSQSWGFCMDFLNYRERVWFLLGCPLFSFTMYSNFTVEVTVYSKEENS
jgi:hypothetical protein